MGSQNISRLHLKCFNMNDNKSHVCKPAKVARRKKNISSPFHWPMGLHVISPPHCSNLPQSHSSLMWWLEIIMGELKECPHCFHSFPDTVWHVTFVMRSGHIFLGSLRRARENMRQVNWFWPTKMIFISNGMSFRHNHPKRVSPIKLETLES